MAGRLIALEGIDGSGLTTQAARLAAGLRAVGQPAYATKEPTQGPVGGLLRLALGGRLGGYPRPAADGEDRAVPLDAHVVALLFAADRLDHLASEVEPRLTAGSIVICDRYLLSSLAYQALDVDLEWLRAINKQARPADLTIFLDVPPETALQRVLRRGGQIEVYERLESLRHIRDNYLARLADLRGAAGGRVCLVDGTGTLEEVTAALLRVVDEQSEGGTGP